MPGPPTPARYCPECWHRGPEATCPVDGFPLVPEHGTATPPEDLTGRVFEGRYVIEAPLGAGGMARVYRARHLTMRSEVALKVMRHDLGGDVTGVRRFCREARACALLTHPNTIRVTDFGASEEGLLFLAMEYLDGETLGARLARVGRLPPVEAVAIARAVCRSLDEAHEAGIVHRDLKPDNIMLCRLHKVTDHVKVVDFGIARLGEDATGLTASQMVVGTPRYLSPEQIAGEAVDRRADLYALGLVLYEMLAGRHPFDAPVIVELLAQQLHAAPPPLPSDVPAALRAVVERLLRKHPAERPATAADVDAELGRLELPAAPTSGAPGPAIPKTEVVVPPTEANVPLVALTAPAPTGDLRRRRRPRRLARNVAALVLGFAVVVWWEWPRDRAPEAPVAAGVAAAPAAVTGGHTERRQPEPPVDSGRRDAARDVLPAPPLAAALPADPPPAAPVPGLWPEPAVPPIGGTGGDRSIEVVTEPPGAAVVDGVRVLGATPLPVTLQPGEQRVIRVRRQGHRDAVVTVTAASPSPLVVRLERLPRSAKRGIVVPYD